MYFNYFQTGNTIELFNPNNRDLLSHWKFTGTNYKSYDNNLRCSMYILNSGGSRIQLPNKKPESLGLIHNYIVFQLYLFSTKQFSIEIAISDTQNIKRRLVFSTSIKEITTNYFSSLIPLIDFPVGVWVNLSIDTLSFTVDCFKSLTYKSIESISLCANCKVRKIFTMKGRMYTDLDTNDHKEENKDTINTTAVLFEKIPVAMDLPKGANAKNINLIYEKVNEQINQSLTESKKEDYSASSNLSYNQGRLSRYNNNSANKLNIKNKSPPKSTYDLSNRRSKSSIKNQNLKPITQQEVVGEVSNTTPLTQKNNFIQSKGKKSKIKKNKVPKHTTKKNKAINESNSISKNDAIEDIKPKMKFPTNNNLKPIHNSNGNVNNHIDNKYKENDNTIETNNKIIQQVSLDKEKLAQFNTFSYNPKNEYRRESTVESNQIEEVCVFDSQIALYNFQENENDIIQIDDLILPPNDYIQDLKDIKQKTQDIAQQIMKEKKKKQEIIHDLLDYNPLKNSIEKSLERPFSPPINNKINEDDLFDDNFHMADSISFEKENK